MCGARTPAGPPNRAKLSRRALRWALEGIVCQHLTVARVAEGLGVSWNTANDAVLAEGSSVLIEDPHRFDRRIQAPTSPSIMKSPFPRIIRGMCGLYSR